MANQDQDTTERRIALASKLMGKALAQLARTDPEMARRLGAALSAEVQAMR